MLLQVKIHISKANKNLPSILFKTSKQGEKTPRTDLFHVTFSDQNPNKN